MTKEEMNKYMREYRKTEKGKINRLYNNMKSNSKQRGMDGQDFTKDELSIWLYKNGFKELFEKWVESDFDKMKSPSVDRLDDYKSYTFDNMRLITWYENLKKAHADRKNGVNNKHSKSVNQIDKVTGEIINTFTGQNEASRRTGINQATICKVCLGKRNLAGGFRWEYT